MANDIQSAGKEMFELAAEPKKNNNMWMVFVGIGFLAWAIFGYTITLNNMAQEQANSICGTCQENLGIMVNNFDALAKTCSEAKQYQKNISILPGVFNHTVSVYAS